MTTIAADQAKNEFETLLSRAAQGEEFTITADGTPVARLVPVLPTPSVPESAGESMTLRELQELREKAPLHASQDVASAIDRIRELRKGNRLGRDLSIRQLIDEGRRF
ncbi:MAG TPA: type II toxin-antitoxin system prevent-host-death family antitoxin [Phycisphaerae bacterium]|jgi:prevent-host-death family protein|nr:type II toxin-antitoxin system prevent-host-death family antitoxin [Phycisphaerae bacterium]HOB75053.1 type II toxin-antitoxin system prevent-host-death family antitoxin [Phycisphaerae bacterium]HOJ54812.1 type II toxin-antitoxin system prevent-host-death family antitoxin [Phycisphaerae bacterium]HOL26910.1 type II toxin-antitoxin system prevent-host-death family antitoxin [Phycisphaerae bacterium]HPP20865.1 type II toxin-antitoxin system prevent-host-death family antitoxin [Phycisphaerae ba